MTDSTSSQTPLSCDGRYAKIRRYAEKAREISKHGDTFLAKSLQWRKKVGKLKVPQLIDLGIAMNAAEDSDAEANSAVAARLKLLRDVTTSLIHHHNSSHLETVITDLDTSTKRLDDTMLDLTIVGIILSLVQVLLSLAPALNQRPLKLGLGIVLTLLLLRVVMRYVTWAAVKRQSAAKRANARLRQG